MRPVVRVTVACACLSGTALSQSVDAQVPSDSQKAEGTTLEEVVVTAQKREERLQDVPISMSVLGGDTLDRSSDSGVIEAVGRVPGVFASVTNQGARSGGNAAIAIRGVSASTVGAGTTAYYVDSIPFGRAEVSFVPDTNPFDLDRVEVLRGPQGTLYGASALNGVVRVLTRNPNFQDVEFKARASLSSTDRGGESYSGDAAFNMPIIDDKLAARVVLGYQDLGGWIDKPNKADVNDTTKTNARVKLAARPTDNLSIGLSGWISRTDSGAPPFSVDGGRTNPSTVDERSENDFDSYSLDLAYDASVLTIKSATSYLEYTLNNNFDFSAIPGQVPGSIQVARTNSTVFAEELVLNSAGNGPWRWTLGSMYRNAQDNRNQGIHLPVPPDGPADIWHVESKSTAVFGEITRAFADGQFELTGGLRYFRDERREWEDSRSTAYPDGIPVGGLLTIPNTFNKTTPRVVLNWHPSKDSTLYASYSKGFRSGLEQGFSVKQTYPDLPPVAPDTLTNYEIGAKASTLGGRLTFDTAVYYIDWQDVQQDSSVLVNGAPTPAYVNGDSLSGVGVDLAVTFAPIESLMLGVNVGWNGLEYDKDVLASGLVEFPKGSRRTNSPKATAGAFIDYTVPLGASGYRGRLSASGNYVSEQITGAKSNLDFVPFPHIVSYDRLTADSMTIVRVGFAVEAPKHWNFSLYVDNLTDEEGIQPDVFAPGGEYNVVIRPRTYGAQFEYRY